LPNLAAGSGSSYLYGHCDANFRPGMSKEECLTFVRNGKSNPRWGFFPPQLCAADCRACVWRSTAVALAMSWDGSSGGVLRTAVITKDGVERDVLVGDQLPKFFES
jgi:20S proteasome subunit beta 1